MRADEFNQQQLEQRREAEHEEWLERIRDKRREQKVEDAAEARILRELESYQENCDE